MAVPVPVSAARRRSLAFYLYERRAREPPRTTPLLRARGTHRERRRAALTGTGTAKMAGLLTQIG